MRALPGKSTVGSGKNKKIDGAVKEEFARISKSSGQIVKRKNSSSSPFLLNWKKVRDASRTVQSAKKRGGHSTAFGYLFCSFALPGSNLAVEGTKL